VTKLRDHARRWWARQTQAFRASAVTAWFTFTATVAYAIARLADDVVTWIDGGAAPVWITAGRAVASAFVTFVAFVSNLWFRTRRPAPYWGPPAGTPAVDLDPPAGAR
jgi:hypothetical protein